MIFLIALLNLIVLGAFSFLIWKKSDLTSRRIFFPALLLKLVAGISLGLVYTYYYTENDTFFFFNDAQTLTSLARSDGFQYFKFLGNGDESFFIWAQLINVKSRSLFFIKILSVVNLFTRDNYWLSSLWFSSLSFIGCWYLFIRITNLIKNSFWPAAISFLFFPSCLFWGSGIIKESISIGALSFVMGISVLFITRQKAKAGEWICLLISLWVLWTLKYYWAAILLPTIITSVLFVYVVDPFIKSKPSWKELISWITVFLILCFGVSLIHPNFHLDRLLEVVVENYNLFIASSKPQGVIHYNHLTATWSSILWNAPWALLSGLFRPFIHEGITLFQIALGIENLILLVLFIFSLKNLLSIPSSSHRLLIYSAIVYVCLLCIFLALSTPNFGTLSRYRIGFIPVFSFLVLYRNPLLRKLTD